MPYTGEHAFLEDDSMIRFPLQRLAVLLVVTVLFLGVPHLADAQKAPGPKLVPPKAAAPTAAGAESRTARAFEDARKQGPLALRAFLYRMPKGADLHSHLSGAIYAESWLRAAGEDNLCVDTKTFAFVRPDAGQYKGTDDQDKHFVAICKSGQVAASEVPKNQHLYDDLIDAFSMRTFVPVTADSGHDHFFDT